MLKRKKLNGIKKTRKGSEWGRTEKNKVSYWHAD